MKTLLKPLIIILALTALTAHAETVNVKYQGNIDLSTYECQDITRSGLVNRICHNDDASEMVILLRNTYYKYCGIGSDTVDALANASSVGRFYNLNIKGKFSCVK